MKSIYRILLTFVAVFGWLTSASATDFSEPVSGRVYRIWNSKNTTHFMYENQTTQRLMTTTISRKDYSDIFLVQKSGEGYTLRNIQSGLYLAKSNNQSSYSTSETPGVFNLVKNTTRTDMDCYDIICSWSQDFGIAELTKNVVGRQFYYSEDDKLDKYKSSEWRFEQVTYTSDMRRQLNSNEKIETGVYYIINDQRHKGTNYYVQYNNNKQGLTITSMLPNKEAFRSFFLFTKLTDSTYTIRDLQSGNYVQKVDGNNQIFKTAKDPYTFTVKQQSKATDGVYWDIFVDPTKGDWCWHADAQNNIVRWHPWIDGGRQGLSPSEWKIVKDTLLTDEEVRQRLVGMSGYVTPESGKTYRIYNNRFSDRVLYQNYTSSSAPLQTQNSDGTYLEVWQLVQADDNTVNLKNVVTGQYIAKTNSRNSNYQVTNNPLQSGFTITANTTDPYATRFYINESGTMGLNDHEGPHNVLSWDVPSDAANIWLFKEVQIDSTELALEQNAYQEQYDIVKNQSTYAKDMLDYFTDNACTILKDEYKAMTDEALTAKMNEQKLPRVLQNTVLKIKNDKWKEYKSKTNWEKRFRIQDYKPYTDVENYNWSREMGIGYLWSRITGPTGITAKRDSTLFIFVDKIPANAKVEAELIPMGTAAGDVTPLKEGMNVLLVRDEYNLNLRYWVNTYANLNNGKPYTLADFPTVKIHVEGGEVNGMFDRTAGDTNETWKTMKDDGLAWAQAFNAKSDYVVFNMPSKYWKQSANDNHMADLVDMWNCIPKDEQELMGFRSEYADRFNGLLAATGVDHNYMYASTYGTYYNYNTLGTVLNYNNFSKRDGQWWGPAHEFGHNHQQLFNMAGMTEISNNVFSNQVLFKNGRVTSRSEYGTVTDLDGVSYQNMPWSQVTSLANYYSRNTDWIDYNLWACTQMMYKLYMYYHAAGNDTTFYQKVFHLMKKDPMTLQKTNRCTGLTDYLKFATTCCEAAQEDLSDLFRAWSFYHPVVNKEIGDYGTTIMNTTQEMIDSALTVMHKYPKKGGNNMMFIEDHIRPTLAIYPGHEEGEMRQNYSQYCAFGRMGDMGNWDQFCPDSQGVARVKLVNKSVKTSNGRVTIETQPLNSYLVGFKVYDGDGNLIWFANQKKFDIPGAVLAKVNNTYVVKACSSNGTEVDLEDATTGIDVVTVENRSDDAPVNVYNVSGTLIRKGVPATSATAGLPAGLYIVGQKKVVVQ